MRLPKKVVPSARVGGNDHEVGIGIGCGAVEGGTEVEGLLGKVFLDIFVLNGRLAVVNLVHLFSHYIYGGDLMMAREQCGYAQADVTCAGYGYLEVGEGSHRV